jgi:hypothetical protein
MEKSLPPTAMSSEDSLVSTKPSDCEGIDCENIMKTSGLLKRPLITGATRGGADQTSPSSGSATCSPRVPNNNSSMVEP